MFRTRFFNTGLPTSLEFHSDLGYYAVPFQANYGTVPYSLSFTSIAALLQVVLRENTEPLRNGLIEMRIRTVNMFLGDAQ